MKVLILTDYFYPHIGGGVEKVVFEVSRRLVKMGVNVIILTLNTKKARNFEILEGIRVYRCNPINLTEATKTQLTISFSLPLKMIEICKREKPDIIHANNRFFFTTVCAVALKILIKKPLITTLHLGPMFFRRRLFDFYIRIYDKTLSRWIFNNSDKLLAVSTSVMKHALNSGASRERIKVIPNGVDISEFRPREGFKGNRIRRIVFIGRLFPNKGAQYLIEAAPIILSKHPATEFVVIGNGPMKMDLIRLARRLNVEQAFRFLGIVQSVPEILKECDIFVRPSLTEGMPLTILEAMACRLPIVASKIPGVSEIVKDGETGILIEPGNIRHLSEALNRLLEDKDYAERIKNNAYNFVRNHYSWDRVAEEYFKIYNEVLKR
ncbi:MAG: glycosyltransferase family 4 protein [Thermoproteota archaeon]